MISFIVALFCSLTANVSLAWAATSSVIAETVETLSTIFLVASLSPFTIFVSYSALIRIFPVLFSIIEKLAAVSFVAASSSFIISTI